MTLKEGIIRFWNRVVKLDGGCCEWTGAKIPDGYGSLQVCYKHTLAHRFSYEITIGPIPKGLYVLHKCDNPACVNPDHLFIGTQKDNVQDCISKGRFTRSDRRGEKCPTSKLTEKDVIYIRQSNLLQRELAEHFGVTRQAIGDIRSRRNWSHVN